MVPLAWLLGGFLIVALIGAEREAKPADRERWVPRIVGGVVILTGAAMLLTVRDRLSVATAVPPLALIALGASVPFLGPRWGWFRVCAHCGRTLGGDWSGDDRFCPRCGRPIAPTKPDHDDRLE